MSKEFKFTQKNLEIVKKNTSTAVLPYQGRVSHYTLGKHFDQHIQQRNILIENKSKLKFGLFQRPLLNSTSQTLHPPFWPFPSLPQASGPLDTPQGHPQA